MLYTAFNNTFLNFLQVLLYHFPDNRQLLKENIALLKEYVQESETKAYLLFKEQVQDCANKTGLSLSECTNRLLKKNPDICNNIHWLSGIAFSQMMECPMSNRKRKKIDRAFVHFVKAYSVISLCKNQTDRIGELAGDIAQQENIRDLRSNPTALLSAVAKLMTERKAEVEEIFDEIINAAEDEEPRADGAGDGGEPGDGDGADDGGGPGNGDGADDGGGPGNGDGADDGGGPGDDDGADDGDGDENTVESKTEPRQEQDNKRAIDNVSSPIDFLTPTMKSQLEVLLHDPDSKNQAKIEDVLSGLKHLFP